MAALVRCKECQLPDNLLREPGEIPEHMWELELLAPGLHSVPTPTAHTEIEVCLVNSPIQWALPSDVCTPQAVNKAADAIAKIPHDLRDAFRCSWRGPGDGPLTVAEAVAFMDSWNAREREAAPRRREQEERDAEAQRKGWEAASRWDGKSPVDVDGMFRALGIDPEQVRLHQLGETTTAEWAPEFGILKRMIAALHSGMNRGYVETTLTPGLMSGWRDLGDAANTGSRPASITVTSTGGCWSGRMYDGVVPVELHRDEWESVGIYPTGPGYLTVTPRDHEQREAGEVTVFIGFAVGALLIEVWKRRQWMESVTRGYVAKPEESPADMPYHAIAAATPGDPT